MNVYIKSRNDFFKLNENAFKITRYIYNHIDKVLTNVRSMMMMKTFNYLNFLFILTNNNKFLFLKNDNVNITSKPFENCYYHSCYMENDKPCEVKGSNR